MGGIFFEVIIAPISVCGEKKQALLNGLDRFFFHSNMLKNFFPSTLHERILSRTLRNRNCLFILDYAFKLSYAFNSRACVRKEKNQIDSNFQTSFFCQKKEEKSLFSLISGLLNVQTSVTSGLFSLSRDGCGRKNKKEKRKRRRRKKIEEGKK